MNSIMMYVNGSAALGKLRTVIIVDIILMLHNPHTN